MGTNVAPKPQFATVLGAFDDLSKTYLHPGQMLVTAEPRAIKTILGSCVSVCLWDAAVRVGGVCHYLIPTWDGEGTASDRYGDVAIRNLLTGMAAHGAQRSRMSAKLFGGSCMFVAMQNNGDHIGARNVAVAIEALHQSGIPILARDTGGTRGRELVFRTSDGTVFSRSV